ncbi:MAG: glutathione S-transferase family protein [Endozoicomonas sp.]
MGMLIDGQWSDRWYDTRKHRGAFKREDARYRNSITVAGESGFKAEPDRYHLYVSLACPWAHRTLIFRAIKRLEDYISVSVVSPRMLDNGWSYDTQTGSTGDPVNNADYHHQIYTKDTPDYTGRVTVPVLWDKQSSRIVSNESSEIIRMFNAAFNHLTGDSQDYYPEGQRRDIDAINDKVYDTINNGVYKTGFATDQNIYEKAYTELFDSLDKLEELLGRQRYLVGSTITEADWRLFTTLVRFDAVYHGHFKCNRKKLMEYPNLWAYTCELYQWPGVAGTVNMQHIKEHYYYSHDMINPTRIVPVGPELDFFQPHEREKLAG